MVTRICTLLLCLVLFLGMLTGCNNNGSKANENINNQDNEYMQTDDDFDYGDETDILDENELSGDTSLAGLEEVKLEGWDSSKKIKQILIDGIKTYILTTDNEVYYNVNDFLGAFEDYGIDYDLDTPWIQNEKIAGLSDSIKFIGSYLFNGDDFYLFYEPLPTTMHKMQKNYSFEIGLIGNNFYGGLFFILDSEGNFRIICRNGNDVFIELNLPPMLMADNVIDIVKGFYLTEDGELREFPTFDRIDSDGTIVEFADYSIFNLLEITDVKQVFDAKCSKYDVFILHNNNSLSYYDGKVKELLEVSSDVGIIKEVIGNDYSFIVVTDSGYYSGRRNGELVPCEMLNNIKDKIISVAWFDYDLVVILDDGKMYKVE